MLFAIEAGKMSSFKKFFGTKPVAVVEPTPLAQDTKPNAVEHVDIDADEKVSVDHQRAAALGLEYIQGSDAEKKLLRKLDFRLLVRIPFLN